MNEQEFKAAFLRLQNEIKTLHAENSRLNERLTALESVNRSRLNPPKYEQAKVISMSEGFFCLSWDQITTRKKRMEVVDIRATIAASVKNVYCLTHNEIARLLNRRDHASVSHIIRETHESQLFTSGDYRERFRRFVELLETA